jgi:hypothetical protein
MAVKALANLAFEGSRDPLAEAIAPPPSETEAERERRLEREREAKRVSDIIDEQIDKDRRAEKPMRILLLGELFSYILEACSHWYQAKANQVSQQGGQVMNRTH